jgi:hypothetical membrane protein
VGRLYERKRSWWLTTGGCIGITVPIVAFTFIGLSILTYPQFSWTNNALSDLGIVPGITANLFNFGLYASGLMSLWFAIGLYKLLSEKVLGKLGAILFGTVSLALEGIGWAPEGTTAFNFPWHYFFSVAFFTLMPIALLVIVGYFMTTRQKELSLFTLLTALVAAAPWVLYFLVRYVPGVAIPELISALAASVWAIVIGWTMFNSESFTQDTDLRP